jgi:Ca2+-binding RTX toxin-like protein
VLAEAQVGKALSVTANYLDGHGTAESVTSSPTSLVGASPFSGTGDAGNNQLTGGAGDDSLSGLAGNDTLIGNAGNDMLDGGQGTDSLVGGAGDDVYRLDILGDTVSEAASAGSDRVELALSAGGTYTLTANVEHATIVNATPGVNLVGNTENNALTGNAAANSLSGAAGDDTLDGAAGDDSLDGGVGNDSLVGGLGNDTLIGGAGADTLAAGPGLDTVYGGADADTLVVLGNFADYTRTRPNATDTRLVFAGAGEDITFRNVESVVFLDGPRTLAEVHLNIASANNDSIVGTAGNDTLDGLAGTDTLVGLDGDDTYFVDVAGDVVTEGDGLRAAAATASTSSSPPAVPTRSPPTSKTPPSPTARPA